MNETRKQYFEDYLKKFGTEGSLMGPLVETILDQEKRIIALEKKK